MFETLSLAAEEIELAEIVLKSGLPSAMPDAESAILQAEAAATGAYLNVRSNIHNIKDKIFVEQTALEIERLFMQIRAVARRGLKLAIKKPDMK